MTVVGSVTTVHIAVMIFMFTMMMAVVKKLIPNQPVYIYKFHHVILTSSYPPLLCH
jgi:hypothetical protein